MKKNFYQHIVNISNKAFLYYNALTDCYLILNPRLHSIYQNTNPEEIKKIDSSLYNILVKDQFIIENNIDEFAITEYNRLKKKFDTNLYHIVINTTLDCNLKCWYCYESKIENSFLSTETANAIKENIKQKYAHSPFKILKITFFGGEPFLNFSCIKDILMFAKNFSSKKNIELIADFTTNATLITQEQLLFLSEFKCYFQITLDGFKEKHNTIRFYKDNKLGTYNDIVRNIHRIHNLIPNSFLWIRTNYDRNTLIHYNELLNEFSDLDRKRVYLILRKIWQLKEDIVEKSIILSTIQKAIDANFFIDYYAIPKTNLCFAERINQALVNYDGKIFKCSTLECFDSEHSYGELQSNGNINWNLNALAKNVKYFSGEECKNCKIFPSCLGRCTQKKSQKEPMKCYLDITKMSLDEFIMYNYKLKTLWRRINE